MKLRSASTWEELHALEGFRLEPVAPEVMQTGAVVGQYDMKSEEMQACGILSCGQPHRHGFIIELPDQSLSNVGKICGQSRLSAKWDGMLSSFKAARKKYSETEALRIEKETADGLMINASERPKELARVLKMLEAFDGLPASLRLQLANRASQNDGVIFRERAPTQKEINQAKFHHEPIPHVKREIVAVLDDIKAVAAHSRADYVHQEKIPRALAALRASCDDATSTAESINQCCKSLQSALELLNTAIDRACRFFDPANIGRLGHLANDAKVTLVEATDSFQITITK